MKALYRVKDSRNKTVGFIVVGKDGVKYGIEVKTNKGNIKSLKVFLDKKLIDKGIVAKATYGGYF